jgi:hypothetical protein
MRDDRKLLLAVLALIGLVVWLLVITINRGGDVQRLQNSIKELQEKKQTPTIPVVINGKTPVLGVDYFNGQSIQGPKGDSIQGPKGDPGASAYDLAVASGFSGSIKDWLSALKGDKGDSARDLDIECVEGVIMKQFTGDTLWQPTNIKCESSHD